MVGNGRLPVSRLEHVGHAGKDYCARKAIRKGTRGDRLNWIGERFGIFEIGAASVKDRARSESGIQGKGKHGELRSQSSRQREEEREEESYTLELGSPRARADSKGREKFQRKACGCGF
jgi:hypothetical protein